MILSNSDVASLKSALNWWEWFGYISQAIVGLGCIGEFLAEFTPLRKSEPSKHKLARLSLMILILGIGGELLSAVRSSNLSGELIANIEERASDAERKAGEANERASKNEKEAAQLRKDAAELEDSISWRRLTPKSQDKLQSDLVRFSVKRTWLLYNVNDPEAFSFGSYLAAALNSAGWHPTEPEPTLKMTEGPVPFGTHVSETRGIVVSTTGEKANDDAADALVKSISALGFDCKKSSKPAVREQNPTPTVFVEIEPRPEGPQGDAKLRAEAEKKKKSSSQTAQP